MTLYYNSISNASKLFYLDVQLLKDIFQNNKLTNCYIPIKYIGKILYWPQISKILLSRLYICSATLVSLMSNSEWLHSSDLAPPRPQWCEENVAFLCL